MFVFVPELFKCNSKLLWRLGSLNGLREAVPKQCSVEEKNCVGSVWCVLWEGLSGMVCVCCGWSAKKEGGKRCLESDGKVFGAWISCWKRQVLAMAHVSSEGRAS